MAAITGAAVLLPASRAVSAPQQRSSSRPVIGSSFLKGSKQQFGGQSLAAEASSSSGSSARRVTVMAAKGERGTRGMAWESNAPPATEHKLNQRCMPARPLEAWGTCQIR
jgi:hypothetical protein